MATWHGSPKNYYLEVYNKGNYGYSDYESVEFNWTYGTVADILTINRKDSNGMTALHFENSEAQAYLYTLAQWMARFEGKERLKTLLKDLLEEE